MSIVKLYLPPTEIIPFLKEIGPQNRIVFVTGGRGAGKTTWCASLIQSARSSCMKIDGFLSPAKFHAGEKTAIQLVNLFNDEVRLLGSLTPLGDGWDQIGCWYFDPQVVAWCNTIVKSAHNAQVVIMDEIGPLELEQKGGFLESVKALDERRFRNTLVVIRPELLDLAYRRWLPEMVIDLDQKAD